MIGLKINPVKFLIEECPAYWGEGHKWQRWGQNSGFIPGLFFCTSTGFVTRDSPQEPLGCFGTGRIGDSAEWSGLSRDTKGLSAQRKRGFLPLCLLFYFWKIVACVLLGVLIPSTLPPGDRAEPPPDGAGGPRLRDPPVLRRTPPGPPPAPKPTDHVEKHLGFANLCESGMLPPPSLRKKYPLIIYKKNTQTSEYGWMNYVQNSNYVRYQLTAAIGCGEIENKNVSRAPSLLSRRLLRPTNRYLYSTPDKKLTTSPHKILKKVSKTAEALSRCHWEECMFLLHEFWVLF